MTVLATRSPYQMVSSCPNYEVGTRLPIIQRVDTTQLHCKGPKLPIEPVERSKQFTEGCGRRLHRNVVYYGGGEVLL